MQAFKVEFVKGTFYYCSLACAAAEKINQYDGHFVLESDYRDGEFCFHCGIVLKDQDRADSYGWGVISAE